MAAKPLASPEVLRQLLRYEPETGKLFWRERGVEWFKPHTKCTAEQVCRGWNARYANKEAFTYTNNEGYRTGQIFSSVYQAHRVIWAMHYVMDETSEIDHRDTDRTNNRLSNLRLADKSKNMQNKSLQSNNKSGFKGVSWDSEHGKWRAFIMANGKSRSLGRFSSKEAAYAAYCEAAERFHGEFARVA